MLKVAQNVYDYFKYGKVVYRSKTSGNVIRKKTDGKRTTKTVLNKERQVIQELCRLINIHNDDFSTVFHKTDFDPNTGIPLSRVKSKVYSIFKDKKRILDHSKPDYDYKITTLSDGRKLYEVAYPEVTVIVKDKGVKTDKFSKSFIE